jgi:hypothetical protein
MRQHPTWDTKGDAPADKRFQRACNSILPTVQMQHIGSATISHCNHDSCPPNHSASAAAAAVLMHQPGRGRGICRIAAAGRRGALSHLCIYTAVYHNTKHMMSRCPRELHGKPAPQLQEQACSCHIVEFTRDDGLPGRRRRDPPHLRVRLPELKNLGAADSGRCLTVR